MFYSGEMRTKTEHKDLSAKSSRKTGARNMDAVTYLKEASALLGLLLVVYLWSLVAMAMQIA